MKIKVTFPGLRNPGSRNYKAVREAVHDNPAVQGRLLSAAERAVTDGQEVEAQESDGPAGRLGVRIVSRGGGDRMARRKALQATLGRISP